jgi:hypothetical protein
MHCELQIPSQQVDRRICLSTLFLGDLGDLTVDTLRKRSSIAAKVQLRDDSYAMACRSRRDEDVAKEQTLHPWTSHFTNI